MGRSPCCEKQHTNKGAWSKEEDERLINYIKLHGEGCWRSLPKAAGLSRCGKSCRLRWINYLRPDLKRGNFTPQEDQLIISLHNILGNKWSLIAAKLSGRTDNEIKNYWNTHIKRKLYNSGIDPTTHAPIKHSTAVAVASSSSTTTTSVAVVSPVLVNNDNNNNNNNNSAVVPVVPTSSSNSVSHNNINMKNEVPLLSDRKFVVADFGVEESVSNSSSGVTMEEIVYPSNINLELSLALPKVPFQQPQGVCICRETLGLIGHYQHCSCMNNMSIVCVSAPPPTSTTGNGFFDFFGAGILRF